MWDYDDIPKKHAALEALSPEQRKAMTWEEARKQFLRKDTLSMAAFNGAEERRNTAPFEAVCIANGFLDLVQDDSATRR